MVSGNPAQSSSKVPTDSQLQLRCDSMLAANAMQLLKGSSTGLQQWQEQQRQQTISAGATTGPATTT